MWEDNAIFNFRSLTSLFLPLSDFCLPLSFTALRLASNTDYAFQLGAWLVHVCVEEDRIWGALRDVRRLLFDGGVTDLSTFQRHNMLHELHTDLGPCCVLGQGI